MPSEGIYLIPHFLLSSVNYHQTKIYDVSCVLSFSHLGKNLITQKSIQQFFRFHFLPSEGIYLIPHFLLSSVNYHQTKIYGIKF